MASNDTTGTTGAMTSADYNAAWALVLMSHSATHYPSVASQHASTATASQSAPASSAATSQVALTARQAALRALNPSIDRSPAAINKSDSSKLQITINQNPPHGQKTHAYGKSVDWSNKWSVSALNDWRTKTFKSALGPLTQHTKRAPMVPMNQAEKNWVKWQGDRKGNQTWGGIATLFNQNFQGQNGRPGRNGEQLMNVYHHLKTKEAANAAAAGSVNAAAQ